MGKHYFGIPEPDIRDVNRDGLGDRRGVGIETRGHCTYFPGTLKVMETNTYYAVYLDGRETALFKSYDRAARHASRLLRGEQ